MQGFIGNPARWCGADCDARHTRCQPLEFRRIGGIGNHETRAATGEAVLQIIAGQKRGGGDHHGAELHRRQHHFPQRHDIAEHEQDAITTLHAKCAEPIGDAVGRHRKLGKAALSRAIANDAKCGAGTMRTSGQLSIKPIKRPVEVIQFRPTEIAIGGGVIATLRQQEIPRGFEGGMAHALMLPNRARSAGRYCSQVKAKPGARAFSSQVISLGDSENATKSHYDIFKPSDVTWRLGKCDQVTL